MANATDARMHWLGGGGGPDLTSLLGSTVKLQVRLEGDVFLYAVGFAPKMDSQSESEREVSLQRQRFLCNGSSECGFFA